jgi:hypothetical protein
MSEDYDYIQILARLMSATSTPMRPTLTFNDSSGWWFNNVCYGENKAAAVKAREEFNNADDLKDVL